MSKINRPYTRNFFVKQDLCFRLFQDVSRLVFQGFARPLCQDVKMFQDLFQGVLRPVCQGVSRLVC